MKWLILDIDNTLICAVDRNKLDRVPQHAWDLNPKTVGSYTVFPRPYLDSFMTSVMAMFEGRVVIWSAGTKDYVQSVVSSMFMHVPHIIWHNDHCKVSANLYGKSRFKDLRMMAQQLNVHQDSLLIIDDHPDVKRTQPNLAYQIPAYEILAGHSAKDNALLHLGVKLYRMLQIQTKGRGRGGEGGTTSAVARTTR